MKVRREAKSHREVRTLPCRGTGQTVSGLEKVKSLSDVIVLWSSKLASYFSFLKSLSRAFPGGLDYSQGRDSAGKCI